MKRIKEFNDENQFAMGEMNLFSTVNRDEVNQKAVGHLLDFMKSLTDNPSRQYQNHRCYDQEGYIITSKTL